MKIEFERLVSRGLSEVLVRELQLSGWKMDVGRLLRLMIMGGLVLFVVTSFALALLTNLGPLVSAAAGMILAIVLWVSVYAMLELRIEQRKSFVESTLPDYLQLTAANVRSGIAIDKSLLLAARPEFGFFSEDVKVIGRELYGGITLQQSMRNLGAKYRSLQLQHTIRMMIEGLQYGGGMTDLLNQIAKDIRSQQMVQKEVSGQMFMYTIFIAFAALIGAPVLYALTSQMITVTNTVWAGILQQNPGGLPTAGVSFLRPSPPKITISEYHNFALAAVFLITGFAAFIVSAISTGSIYKGIRYLPIFVLVGLGVFFLLSTLIGGIFTSISGV